MEEAHTGFIVEGLADAIEAVRCVSQLSRRRCREVFDRRFTAERMSHDYVEVYERLIKKGKYRVVEARA